MNARTHYDVLGVAPGASAEEIRQAYRRRARATHPDLGGSPAEFHAVQVAFDALSDPGRRTIYDASFPSRSGGDPRHAPASPPRTYTPPPPRGLDPFEPMEPVARAPLSTAGVTFRPPLFPPEPPRRRLGRHTPPPAATDFLPMPVLRERIFGEPGSAISDVATVAARRARAAERRTEQAIREGVMPSHPAMRLVNGLRLPGEASLAISHAIVLGRRVVLVSSVMVDAADAAWDGSRITAPELEVRPDVVRGLPLLAPLLQPERTRTTNDADVAVSGLVVIHGASGRLAEPKIRETRGVTGEWVPAVNVAGLLRYLQGAARSELQLQVVDARLLSRVLTLFPGELPG